MSFLPEKYEMPVSENHYMKFEQGDNTFRVLSSAIVGWQYWTDENGKVLNRPVKGCKSVRVKNQSEIKESVLNDTNLKLQHFWSFVVWNYDQQAVQILNLTQMKVMKAIERYVQNPKWGDPKTYDFIVNRTGEELKTEYQTTVNPKEPIDPGIVKLYEDMHIDMTALYRGDDPFKGKQDVEPQVDPEEVEKFEREINKAF